MKCFIAALVLLVALPAGAKTAVAQDHPQGMDHGKAHKDCCDHKTPDGKPMDCCTKKTADGKKLACCEKHAEKGAHSGHESA